MIIDLRVQPPFASYPTRPVRRALEDFRRLPIAPESQENLLGSSGARLLGRAQ